MTQPAPFAPSCSGTSPEDSSGGLTLSALAPGEHERLHQGEIVLRGKDGRYQVWALVAAAPERVWSVLTDYERFPQFLSSVAACRVLERQGGRTVVERHDRRNIGWVPIQVKLVTENWEVGRDRIHYRLLKGNLDSMEGAWHLTAHGHPGTLLIQTIQASASLGPFQSYFLTVFEQGLLDTMGALRREMERVS